MPRLSPSRRVRSLSRSTRRVRSHLFETLEQRNLLATFTWDGGGADNNWQTAENWVDDIAPSNNDDLVFASGATRLTNTNKFVGATFRSITFSGAGYDLQGNALTITDGIENQAGAGFNNVTLDLTLGGSQSFTNNGTNQLGVNKNINLNGHTLTLDGAGSLNLSA